MQSISIQPSLTGYISKGIALCGTMQLRDAMKAFDIAFMFTDGDLKTSHLLLLIKVGLIFSYTHCFITLFRLLLCSMQMNMTMHCCASKS